MEIAQRSRKALRLPGYDYSQSGAYYVTVVTRGRQLLFEDASLKECVHQTWEKLQSRFPQVILDTFVVMPNHLHGIVIINSETNGDVGAIHELPLPDGRAHRRQMLLPKIIGYFKMNPAKRINSLRCTVGASVWQRNYYEHIIRSEVELARVREYIQNNPLQWELDEENPANAVGAIHELPLLLLKERLCSNP
ncbi:MAG: hypothetical protein HW388_672 [Dehalococcoidia bacterium]|nr:hypothetical protein [Dehalococcoidia bacterium]